METLCNALKGFRNWYLDLANERNVRDARFVPIKELVRLSAAARGKCPHVLITASHGGDIEPHELREYLRFLDFIIPHRPRGRQSPAETESVTREYLRQMQLEGRVVPIHYQEPFRRGYSDSKPTADDYLDALKGARDSGAAGWCLHNGAERSVKDGKPRRSFDLRERRLFDLLDSVERLTIERIASLNH